MNKLKFFILTLSIFSGEQAFGFGTLTSEVDYNARRYEAIFNPETGHVIYLLSTSDSHKDAFEQAPLEVEIISNLIQLFFDFYDAYVRSKG